MKKRMIIAISAGVLTVGLLSGITYAKGANAGTSSVVTAPVVNSSDQGSSFYNDMIKIMKDNGFTRQAQYMQNKDYKAMDNYMNNITDEDYNKMIDVMRQNGYGDMANEMQSVGKDNMIKMHNNAGGASGMMR